MSALFKSPNASSRRLTMNPNSRRASRKPYWRITMNTKREVAYRIDPALWAREVLGISPRPWQDTFLRVPRGASILVLTARQVGKTTGAAMAMAHTAIFKPGSLSVVAYPAQRQGAEPIRMVKDMVLKAGATLVTDNKYGIELANGSRVMALPSSEESIRGLTVDGWIVADEAAYLTDEVIAALRPMRAQKPMPRSWLRDSEQSG